MAHHTSAEPPSISRVNVGDRVEVRARFDQRWTRGFEIAEIINDDGALSFYLTRRSDGSRLPSAFTSSEIREERKRETWWL